MATDITELKQYDTQDLLMTEESLQNEFDYIVAQRILQNMLEIGLISLAEFNKIKALNQEKFSLELTSIMPSNP